MTIKTPSYIVKSRHGIWYFQIQIPKILQNNNKRRLFRRSLKTTNRLEALKKAWIWWLRMSDNDFQWENEASEQDERYHLGKILYEKLNELDSHNAIEIDEFFLRLDSREEEAFRFYNDYINNTPVTIKETKDEAPSSTSPLLSQLLDKFISEKKRNWGKKQAKSTENKDYRPKINLFIEILGDKSGNQLSRKDIVKYKDTLFGIPSNKNKKPAYKGKPIQELLNLSIPDEDLLSDTTIKNNFIKIGTFLTWLARNGYADTDLQTPLHGVIKRKQSASLDRDILDEQDLIKLFNNNYYFKREHKKSSHYWIPLLALFTGARLNELCQLHVDDIKLIDKIWVIDINDKDDKRVKSHNAKRQIPIHSILIKKIKFIDYIKSLSEVGGRLFPELKISDDGYGRGISRWFNETYRKNTNVGQEKEEKKTFHSFRHTFANYYKQLGKIDEYRVAEIIGHESQSSKITYGRYGKSTSTAAKKKLIEKLKYEYIEFDKFKLWTN